MVIFLGNRICTFGVDKDLSDQTFTILVGEITIHIFFYFRPLSFLSSTWGSYLGFRLVVTVVFNVLSSCSQRFFFFEKRA